MNNLKNVDEEMLKYRQDRLNKRKLTGIIDLYRIRLYN